MLDGLSAYVGTLHRLELTLNIWFNAAFDAAYAAKLMIQPNARGGISREIIPVFKVSEVARRTAIA